MKLYIDALGNPPEDFTQVSAEEGIARLSSGTVTDVVVGHTTGICAPCKSINDPLCPHCLTGYQLLQWCASTGKWPRNKPVVVGRAVERNSMKYVIERHWASVTVSENEHA